MKYFYHNITKKIFNETDTVDLVDNMSDGDEIYISEAGNALVKPLPESELEEIKKRVKEYYEDDRSGTELD